MATHKRNPETTSVGVSMPFALLAQVDARRATLRLSRSDYFRRLAEADLKKGGVLVIDDHPAVTPPAPAPGPAASDIQDKAQTVADLLLRETVAKVKGARGKASRAPLKAHE